MAWFTAVDRFWSKVEKTDDHWYWRGTLVTDHGGRQYGQFYVGRVDGKKVQVPAHRYSYELATGQPLDQTLVPDHLCGETRCVRPNHLEAVPGKVNVLRGRGPSAVNARRTTCTNGHAFDQKNTYVHPRTGRRACRRCVADAQARRRARL